jgi:hypothetical protein
MFKEYNDHKGITIEQLDEILLVNREEECSAIVFRDSGLKTHVAIVEFELILAFMFLVNELAAEGISVDSYLAKTLNTIAPSFKTEVMEHFARFRINNGVETKEDVIFLKNKDFSIYEIEADDSISESTLH